MFELNPITMKLDGTPKSFKDRCFTFLNVLCNDKDLEGAASYLASDCILVHEDHPPVHGPRAFLEVWRRNLKGMPAYQKDIRDMVVEMEPGQAGIARVWVFSRIRGIARNAVTDSIDMMRFTADGRFLESKDVQRTSKEA